MLIEHGCEADSTMGSDLGGVGRASGPDVQVHPAESTNRPGGNRHGGEDTVDLGWQVQWPEESWAKISKELKCAQDAARAGDAEGSIVRVGNRDFVIRAAGRAVGNVYYAYSGESEGMRLEFMDRAMPWAKTPNVRMHLGSIALMLLGLDEAYRRMREAITSAGGQIVRETVSRIDPSVDLIGVEASDFVQAIMEYRCVRRGRKVAYHQDGLRWSGVTVGMGGVISLRIYDKVLESLNQPEKWGCLIACRYDGEVPSTATRVEFQIRRRALKEFEVNSIQEWIEKRAEILRYLTEEWFRLVDTPVDRRNTERFSASPFWTRIAEEFSSWCGAAEASAKRIARSCFDYKQVRRQIFGCLASLAAKWGHQLNDVGDFVDVLWDCVRDERDGGSAPSVVRRAQAKRASCDVTFCFE